MSVRLILIRHGETVWNREKRYLGSTDIALSDNGIDQAKKTAKRLTQEPIDTVYSSDLKRAHAFAQLATRNTQIQTTQNLREIAFGIFEGKTHHEIMTEHNAIYATWLNNPLKTKIPQGERMTRFVRRIRHELKTIITLNKNKSIALITHAGVLKIICCDLLKIKINQFWNIKIDLASLTTVEIIGSKTKIFKLNDTEHLNA